MAIKDDDEAFRAMQARLADLLPRLNERDRRAAMGTEAKSWGRGGISAVQRATGASRTTIRRGMAELADGEPQQSRRRVRAPGGGHKKAEVNDLELLDALDTLIEPNGRHLATTNDRTARIWDGGTGSQRAVLRGHNNWIHDVAWSPDGQRLATASGDRTVRIWDIGNGRDLVANAHRRVYRELTAGERRNLMLPPTG